MKDFEQKAEEFCNGRNIIITTLADKRKLLEVVAKLLRDQDRESRAAMKKEAAEVARNTEIVEAKRGSIYAQLGDAAATREEIATAIENIKE